MEGARFHCPAPQILCGAPLAAAGRYGISVLAFGHGWAAKSQIAASVHISRIEGIPAASDEVVAAPEADGESDVMRLARVEGPAPPIKSLNFRGGLKVQTPNET